MALNKNQLKSLKNLAHHLNPVVTIGQNGITDNVMNEVEIALDHHELVKIKLAASDRDDRVELIETLCNQTGAEKVQAIGKTVTLFRRNPKKPKIQF